MEKISKGDIWQLGPLYDIIKMNAKRLYLKTETTVYDNSVPVSMTNRFCRITDVTSTFISAELLYNRYANHESNDNPRSIRLEIHPGTRMFLWEALATFGAFLNIPEIDGGAKGIQQAHLGAVVEVEENKNGTAIVHFIERQEEIPIASKVIYPTVITIEGIDGIGKKTMSDALVRTLKRCGRKTHLVSFPNYASHTGKMMKRFLAGELIGDPIQADPYVSSMLFLFDRMNYYGDHMDEMMESDYIIMDRGFLSAIFYQGAKLFTDEDEITPSLEMFCRRMATLEIDSTFLKHCDVFNYYLTRANTSAVAVATEHLGERTTQDLYENNTTYLTQVHDFSRWLITEMMESPIHPKFKIYPIEVPEVPMCRHRDRNIQTVTQIIANQIAMMVGLVIDDAVLLETLHSNIVKEVEIDGN